MTDSHTAADPPTLDARHSQLAGATGAARAGVDVATSGASHTARQIVYALAHGAAETLALEAVHADGVAIHDAAVAVRRRLPRDYGDPLNPDPGWPA